MIDAVEQSSAAGQYHAAVINVCGDLGAELGQRIFDLFSGAADDAFDDGIYLARGDLDSGRAARLNVAAADLDGLGEIVRKIGGGEFRFQVLYGLIADLQPAMPAEMLAVLMRLTLRCGATWGWAAAAACTTACFIESSSAA